MWKRQQQDLNLHNISVGRLSKPLWYHYTMLANWCVAKSSCTWTGFWKLFVANYGRLPPITWQTCYQSTSLFALRYLPHTNWQGGDWTHDTSVNSRLLYQLSYMPIDNLCLNDAWENRTHVSAMKRRCLNHLTNAPCPLFVLLAERWQGYTKIESKGVLLCASFEAVGIAGFEPTTSPSQVERSAKLNYIP